MANCRFLQEPDLDLLLETRSAYSVWRCSCDRNDLFILRDAEFGVPLVAGFWPQEGIIRLRRIKELDGLRAFAIGAVFLVHFRPVYHSIFNFLAFGWAGVDLFFVISGFLITNILLDLRQHPTPFRRFYWRRALRIFPPYYLALTMVLLLAYLHGEEIPIRERLEALLFVSSLKGVSLQLMVDRLVFQSGQPVSPIPLDFHHYVLFERGLRVFWSLSVEELFYLFWAPIVLKGSKRFITICSIAPLLLCPIIRALSHTSTYLESANFFARFDSLSIGACLALLFFAVKRGLVSGRVIEGGALTAMPVSVMALILLCWRCGVFQNIQVRSTTAFTVFGYSLIAVFFASIVALCIRWSETKATRLLRLEPLVYFGSISYMMYLIHLPVYVGIGLALASFQPVSYRMILQRVVAISLTFGLAALSWKYFESPILKLKDRKFRVFESRAPSSERPCQVEPAPPQIDVTHVRAD